jgi:hypothetical protein
MEVAMNATIESPGPSILTDEKIIAALKKSGPLTIEELRCGVSAQDRSRVPGDL